MEPKQLSIIMNININIKNTLIDLNIVNLNETKSIVLLSTENTPYADAQTIKVLLAVINHPERGRQKFHLVAQMKQKKNILI